MCTLTYFVCNKKIYVDVALYGAEKPCRTSKLKHLKLKNLSKLEFSKAKKMSCIFMTHSYI